LKGDSVFHAWQKCKVAKKRYQCLTDFLFQNDLSLQTLTSCA
jgi:hypothetical protein